MRKGSCCRHSITLCLLVASLVFGAARAESRITGRVEDGTGAGVPAASVALVSPNLPSPIGQTKADAEGNFVLAGLPPGKYDFVVVVPGFRFFHLDKIDLVEGETLALPVIKLQIGGCGFGSEPPTGLKLAPAGAPTPLAGRFIDTKGWAVGGVTVSLQRYGEGKSKPLSTQTKSDGTFRFVDLHPDDYKLVATKRGYYPTETSIRTLQGYSVDPYTLRLERCPTAACRTQDREIHFCE